jgi:hypothetical protein
MIKLIAMLLCAAPEETPAPPEDDTYTGKRHFEITMGFTGGVRDETRTGFGFTGGTSPAQALTAPFSLAPYDRTVVYGLAWDVRYVTQHVRFTVGLQKPFASFRMTDAVTGEVGTRSLSLWDIRFGLGTEYAFKHVTPYVDVIGDVQKVDAALTVGTETANYSAWTFGFVVRAGVRVHMGEALFLAPAGEIGLGGPVRWGVGLQAGWVLPIG